MSEPIYTLRPRDPEGSGQYDLVKWADFLAGHKEPLDVYYMQSNYCGCPSPRNPCKHQTIKNTILSYARQRGLPVYSVVYEAGECYVASDMPKDNI